MRILHVHSNHAARQRTRCRSSHTYHLIATLATNLSARVRMGAELAIRRWALAWVSLAPRETNARALISAFDTPTVLYGRANIAPLTCELPEIDIKSGSASS